MTRRFLWVMGMALVALLVVSWAIWALKFCTNCGW